MGKLVYLDQDVIELLDEKKLELIKMKKKVSYSNTVRLIGGLSVRK